MQISNQYAVHTPETNKICLPCNNRLTPRLNKKGNSSTNEKI